MNRRLKILIIGAGIFIIPVLVSPLPNFKAPLSTVVEAREGSLFGARIAADGQWRFPASGKVPEKFKKALLTFEDRYFFYHPGNIISDECVFRPNISFGHLNRLNTAVAIVFIIYAMAGYQLVGYFLGHVYPKFSTFGLVLYSDIYFRGIINNK